MINNDDVTTNKKPKQFTEFGISLKEKNRIVKKTKQFDLKEKKKIQQHQFLEIDVQGAL